MISAFHFFQVFALTLLRKCEVDLIVVDLTFSTRYGNVLFPVEVV